MRRTLFLTAALSAITLPGSTRADQPPRPREIRRAFALPGGRLTLAETENGVSLLDGSPDAPGEIRWNHPFACALSVAGDMAVFKVLESSHDRLVEASFADPAQPALRTIAQMHEFGGTAMLEHDARLHLAYSGVAEDGIEQIYYACRSDGIWTAPQRVSDPGPWPQTSPAIAMANGQVVIAWSGYDGEDYEIHSAALMQDGTFVSRQVTDNCGTADTSPAFACDPVGGCELEWQRYDGVSPRYTVITGVGADGSIVDYSAEPPRSGELIEKPQETGVNRFLGFGDSITDGASDSGHSQSTRYGYFPALIDWLDRSYGQASAFNEGQGGEVTAEGLGRVQRALDSIQPGYVLLMEGTNDVTRSTAAATIAENLRQMAMKCIAAGAVPIVATLIPRGPGDNFDPYNLTTMRTNEEIRADWVTDRLAGADMFAAFMEEPSYLSLFSDHVHPNSRGYDLLGRTWGDGIRQVSPRVPASPAGAQVGTKKQVLLNWIANADSDTAGYIVYFGTATNVYDRVLDVGNKAAARIGVPEYGTTYYFRTRCYDKLGNMSGLSSEAIVTVQK